MKSTVALTARQQAVLAELTAEFAARLAAMQGPEARAKIDAVMDLRGDLNKLADRPKAGKSY